MLTNRILSLSPKNYNKSMVLEGQNAYTPLNSCARKPTLPQITSYTILILVNIAFWCFLQKQFADSTTRFMMIALFSVSLMLLLLTGLITSILDPSDPVLQQYCRGNTEVYRRHMDECLYCDYCSSYVLNTSRHCKQCDRCVQAFDHHCIWINNCIGGFNYREFVAMIFSALIHLLLFIISAALLWSEHTWQQYVGQMVFIWIAAIVALIFSIMVAGLIGLHMFLIHNGLTTFEYILSKKTMSERQKFATPIKPKQQPNNVSEQKNTREVGHQVTQNYYQPSAFEEVRGPQQLERTNFPSGQFLKQEPRRRQFPKITPFQTLQIQKEDELEQELAQIYRKNRSLKLLVGSSVRVKQRKSSIGSMHESLSQRSRPRKMTGESFQSNKDEQFESLPVKYFKEYHQDEEQLDKTK